MLHEAHTHWTCRAAPPLPFSGINAVPELRHILDSFLGKTPAGRQRLHGDGLLQAFTRQSPSRPDTETSAYEQERFVELDVGSELQVSSERQRPRSLFVSR